ncbi:MAG: AI-2E family transporter, partial [Dehalococcoidia bacterium]
VVLWVLWMAGAAMAPFLLGALIAYLLSPLVQWLTGWTSWGGRPQPRWARPVAILVIYLGAAGTLTGLGFWAAPAVSRAFQDLFNRREEIMAGVEQELERVLFWYRARVPDEAQAQIDAWAQDALGQAGTLIAGVAQGTFGYALQSVSVFLGFLVIPIWLFLFVKDQPRFAMWFYGLFPAWLRPDVREVVTGASHILGSYIRAQTVLALTVGLMSYVGLTLLGAPFAIPLAVAAFVLEFIPIIGPILAGAIALMAVLAVDPGMMLLWVFLLYFGIQQFENYVLVPRIQGRAMHVHPALVIVLVVLLGQIMGIVGVLIAVPGYALLRNTYLYIYHRLGEGDHVPDAMPASATREPVSAEVRRQDGEGRKEEAA